MELRRQKDEIKKRKEQRLENRATKARLEELKTLPQLHKEAQKEFNRYVRLRDAGLPCICCDERLTDTNLTGGGWDCGHYRSVGSAGHLRYTETNAAAQRKYCNQYLAGNIIGYRVGLIRRIGLEAVEALEANNTPHKWTRQEVREIRDTYRAKANALEKEQR